MPGTNAQSLTYRTVEMSEPGSIGALRLLSTTSGLRLLTSTTRAGGGGADAYQTSIRGIPLEGSGGAETVLTISHLLPVAPGWDASWEPDHSVSFIYDLAGGAVNSLVLEGGGAEEAVAVSPRYPMESFSSARFVRSGEPGHRGVTAVVDKARLVWFPPDAAGLSPDYRPLDDCYEGLMISRPGGWLLFCKSLVSGPSRGNVLPGALRVQLLDPDLNTVGAPSRPFGNLLIYEFDAAWMAAGLAVLAVTERGMALATTPDQDTAYEADLLTVSDPAASYSRPSIASGTEQVTFAVLVGEGTADARVILGQLAARGGR